MGQPEPGAGCFAADHEGGLGRRANLLSLAGPSDQMGDMEANRVTAGGQTRSQGYDQRRTRLALAHLAKGDAERRWMNLGTLPLPIPTTSSQALVMPTCVARNPGRTRLSQTADALEKKPRSHHRPVLAWPSLGCQKIPQGRGNFEKAVAQSPDFSLRLRVWRPRQPTKSPMKRVDDFEKVARRKNVQALFGNGGIDGAKQRQT